jgi:hypothetical protein
MNRQLTFFSGIGIGIGLLYGLELARDADRRERVRATCSRAAALVTALRSRIAFRSQRDRALVEQVRSEIGRVLERPHAIEVQARRGHVTLTGAIRDDEIDQVVARVAHLPGVKDVNNRLVVVESEVGRAS